MNIKDLPSELQNKIFYYTAEHPCAKMIKDSYYTEIRRLESPQYFDLYDEVMIDKSEAKYITNCFYQGNGKSIKIDPYFCPILIERNSITDWSELYHYIKKKKYPSDYTKIDNDGNYIRCYYNINTNRWIT